VQNAIAGGTDRASTARALLRGESLTSFEASIEEGRRNAEEDGAPLPIDVAMVDVAVTAVATTIFSHRVLEIQRLWMNRGMRKPYELTTRKTAAAITWINNALPLLPGGTDASKFSNAEVIGLLEWSLPPSWRSKFDLDGYIPTLGTKAKLIENCEAIERNQTDAQQAKTTHKETKTQSEKSQNSTGKRESGTNNKYCSEHGKNSTHNTSDCFTIKNRKDNRQNGNEKNGKTVCRSFSNRNFRKELNAMAKKSSRKEVLDLYASAIAREKTKYNEASKKKSLGKT
jgi:Tfp pilus assembly protein PilE